MARRRRRLGRRVEVPKKVVEPRRLQAPLAQADVLAAFDLAEDPELPEPSHPPHAGLRERLARRVGGWMVRRLQKRVEREWREYDHTPKVSLGPWSRRRSERGDTQVYRSLVQIHFHPREGPRR